MAVPSTSKWQPQTALYDYNYGVGMQFYQPMVDYIDEKERGRKTQYPHLPWTDERGLDQYDPMKIIKNYSPTDLSRIARKTDISHSAFVLNQSVSEATLTEKVTKREVRKKKALVREIKKIKTKMADDIIDYNPDEDKEIERSLKASQKYLRGKSAKAIEAYLKNESMRNISQSVEHGSTKKYQKNVVVRSHDYAGHLTLMDKRMQQQLENSFVEPLDTLSAELKCFDKRTTNYFYDKR